MDVDSNDRFSERNRTNFLSIDRRISSKVYENETTSYSYGLYRSLASVTKMEVRTTLIFTRVEKDGRISVLLLHFFYRFFSDFQFRIFDWHRWWSNRSDRIRKSIFWWRLDTKTNDDRWFRQTILSQRTTSKFVLNIRQEMIFSFLF